MNKQIYQQSGILLSTGDTFVETPSIPIPSTSGGILIARISSVGGGGSTSIPDASYVGELVCRFQKDDSGILTLATSTIIYESGNIPGRPSFVVNSNNIRVRFTRNGASYDTNWIVDMDMLYINI
jgi:hypothetical protein